MPPAINDITADTPRSAYMVSRGGYKPILLVLHDTEGSSNYPDRNNLGLTQEQYAAREQGTIGWFQRDNGISVHYLIGPEATGGRIWRLTPESGAAYHAGGDPPQFPASWTDQKTGKVWGGTLLGIGATNVISIGIERWGGAKGDYVGPKQTQSMLELAVDIALRYNLEPYQIVAHAELEGDRSDGWVLRDQVREAVRLARANQKPPQPPQLPWGAVQLPSGLLQFNGITLHPAFQHQFLTMFGAVNPPTATELPKAIDRGVKAFGLPITEVFKDPADSSIERQAFERYVFELNYKASADWQKTGAHAGASYVQMNPTQFGRAISGQQVAELHSNEYIINPNTPEIEQQNDLLSAVATTATAASIEAETAVPTSAGATTEEN